ncbi:MAG TPA: hypothetical protein VG826_14790 [Pirellulales bacterium]|nr:hypothetical protein [Pirellulales bacterium]
MRRFSALLAIVLLCGAMQAEALSAWPARRTVAGPPLATATAGRYGYGPGWAYSSYYGGPVYYHYANPNAMLPRAPAYPVWPSYGFTYNNLYPGAAYNYGWYVFQY